MKVFGNVFSRVRARAELLTARAVFCHTLVSVLDAYPRAECTRASNFSGTSTPSQQSFHVGSAKPWTGELLLRSTSQPTDDVVHHLGSSAGVLKGNGTFGLMR